MNCVDLKLEMNNRSYYTSYGGYNFSVAIVKKKSWKSNMAFYIQPNNYLNNTIIIEVENCRRKRVDRVGKKYYQQEKDCRGHE